MTDKKDRFKPVILDKDKLVVVLRDIKCKLHSLCFPMGYELPHVMRDVWDLFIEFRNVLFTLSDMGVIYVYQNGDNPFAFDIYKNYEQFLELTRKLDG